MALSGLVLVSVYLLISLLHSISLGGSAFDFILNNAKELLSFWVWSGSALAVICGGVFAAIAPNKPQ